MNVLMVGIAVVTVLIGGVPVPSSRPATIQSGTVLVPIDPFIRELAREVIVDPAGGTVWIRRGGLSTTVRVSSGDDVADGAIYVPLAVVVRAIGGTVRFDAVRKVLAVEMPAAGPLATPTPFDPADPTVAPRQVFTPQPIATPRPSPSGSPQPRRTPIPVVPSYPALENP